MRVFKRILNYSLILIILTLPTTISFSKTTPSSFADLAERLMPSVVNISSTQTIKSTGNPFPFQFPPGSPLKICSKNLIDQQKEKQQHLAQVLL